ncbi:hypothetical protein Golob_026308 [Gossypium lobatum]|uniref:CCHC-type domain-containing protein n=1 Tax=Gossypium lobatum TaxID=34289 RepID=A0A7J8LUZ1_9ROSI|nr:hypothetical protein [Gossypium lobatum]
MVKCCTGHKLGSLAPDLAEVMAWLREINYDRLWSNQIVLRKVRFKDLDSNSNSDMAVDSTPTSGTSWIDKVLGRGTSGSGSLIRKVTKLDFQTDKGSTGKFTQMAVFIDLGKPLISQILVKKVVQRVEFESLPLVCFYCGRFGHMQNLCPSSGSANVTEVDTVSAVEVSLEKYKVVETMEVFGPWMLVEQKAWRNSRN